MTVLLLIVCIGSFYPKIKLLFNLKKEINISDRLLRTKERNADSYSNNIAVYDSLLAEREALLGVVLPYGEAVSAATGIRDIMGNYKLAETLYYAEDGGKPDNAQEIGRLDIYIDGYGEYEDIIGFLHEINNGLIHYGIDHITLKGTDFGYILMSLRLSLITLRQGADNTGEEEAPAVHGTGRNPFEAAK